jgi:hypothetical protein
MDRLNNTNQTPKKRAFKRSIFIPLQGLGVLFFLSFSTFAQKSYVLGRAVDKVTGKPVPSATVVNKDTKQVTKSSENGNFLVRGWL